jgi:hypothetical protein
MAAERNVFTFNRKAEFGPGVISTLLKVDAWASSIGLDSPSDVSPGSTACDVIEQLAQSLIAEASGIEKQLLLKSLLEAFLYSVGLDTDLTAEEIMTRLRQFVHHRGKAAIIEQFLSLYFFNRVWLGEARWSPAEDHEVVGLERMCRRAVIAAYAPDDLMDRSTAEILVHNIQTELRELMKLAG